MSKCCQNESNASRGNNEHTGSPGFDNEAGAEFEDNNIFATAGEKAADAPETVEKSANKKRKAAEATKAPSNSSKKQKGILGDLVETLEKERELKVELGKQRELGKLERERVKAKGQLKVEELRLIGEREKREHEMAMLKMRMVMMAPHRSGELRVFGISRTTLEG